MQAVADALGRPLLCTSVNVDAAADDEDSDDEDEEDGVPAPIKALRAPDVGSLLHMYGPRGLDFVVDAARPASTYFPSSVSTHAYMRAASLIHHTGSCITRACLMACVERVQAA